MIKIFFVVVGIFIIIDLDLHKDFCVLDSRHEA